MGVDLGKMFSGGVGTQVQGANNWGTLGTLAGGVGQLASGIGSAQQYGYLASVANRNAEIMDANSQATQAAGALTASEIKTRTGATIGAQKAAQGANNVDVNVGSPVQVRESTRAVGDLDAALAQYNASRSAFSEDLQASALRTQAKLNQRAETGALLSGITNAGTSILGGASSLASKWAQFRTTGAAVPSAGG